ncbi:predicted protein [Sparassis crispa]|uniref:MFS general substrate transporter n=1 Tax=Sparassis crispa TaxID=139825 RepID=A0A401GXU9_9APHY|nr:predicted protein [Sparassis crispa]GBE87055.1 predicted protein [Sparassis crispa]
MGVSFVRPFELVLSKLDASDKAVRIEEVEQVEYRLYRRRWVGLVAIMILNVVAGMPLVWFGPIADDVVNQFGITLDQVNWLGNVVNVIYVPCACVIPTLYSCIGLKRSCYVGAICFIVSGWIRYAATAKPLSMNGAFALMLLGQVLAGFAQPIFQVLIPRYSEKWFDLRGRTTATMLMSIANPIGTGLSQLISPLCGTPSQSLLILGIVFSAATPLVFFIEDAPPTPPTPSAAEQNPSFRSLVIALIGKTPHDAPTYMTFRQRIDFVVMALIFGVLVGITTSFSILTAQDFEPYGYGDLISGLMGATILLVGIVAAVISAPLFDRVLSHHLALSCKCLCPILGASWLSLIWAVRANNTGALFAVMAIIGASSLTLLPVALELAVELTRNADGSSAVLWGSANLFAVIFVVVEGALRAGPDARPPYNMSRALIFQGVLACTIVVALALEGKQQRRAEDERRIAAARAVTGDALRLAEIVRRSDGKSDAGTGSGLDV